MHLSQLQCNIIVILDELVPVCLHLVLPTPISPTLAQKVAFRLLFKK